MSFIQDYRRDLDDQRRIVGSDNEGALSQAFAALLKSMAVEHKLIFTQQYPFTPKDSKAKLRADGVLVDRLRLAHGWWEAKDSKDDLDKEIEAKIAKGYPTDNIIFEDTRTAVLLQHGQEVLRIALSDDEKLQKLLDTFFGYLPREVEDFRLAKAKFLHELPSVASALKNMATDAYTTNAHFKAKAVDFLALCKRAVGERVTAQHVDEMLIQHVLTDQIFQAVFPASAFHRANHLARAITDLEMIFLRGEARMSLLARLEPYFAAIRRAAANAITSEEKQSFLKEVYEDFYTAYNPKDADKLGVVYTPNEAVRFIVEGCDWLAQTHFNRRLADVGMDILDPCTGTGTFIVDLIDYLRGDRQALVRKFEHEMHANEISILPYYIACLNIEQTFYDATQHWKDFSGACFVNTLENWGFEQKHQGAQYDLLGGLTDENHERILAQNARKIPVIMGNPPYNANQQNENDNNKNEAAPMADKRIKETYLAASTAQKTKLYDPYIRFFRWASDRIGEEGMIGFITNRSYLDSRQADGFRNVIAQEFQEVWIVDLMSDVRKNPKISGTKHNIFGIQTGVAIVFLVRNPKRDGCDIRHLALDDDMTAVDKRRWLASHQLRQLFKAGEFARITPNARGEWLNQPEHDWSSWLAVASKDGKAGKTDEVIFKLHSLGISTNRDEWVYDNNRDSLTRKMKFFVEHFKRQQIGEAFNDDIKWSRNLKRRFEQKRQETFDTSRLRPSLYRPYCIRWFYDSSLFIDERGSAQAMFPSKPVQENIVIGFIGDATDKPFSVLVGNQICDLNFLSPAAAGTKLLPFYHYDTSGGGHDNITDWALKQFQARYPDAAMDKQAIFDYVYAVLHHPAYREKYALNLKSEFPRIPFYTDFQQWAAWGKQLIALHTRYADLAAYPLTRLEVSAAKPSQQNALAGMGEQGKQVSFALNATAPKCKLKANKTDGTIDIDALTQLTGIPPEAWTYRLGNRSAIEWVLEEYRDYNPKDPTIKEKFHTYRFADHKEAVITLIGKVCRVSVETAAITAQMQSTGEV